MWIVGGMYTLGSVVSFVSDYLWGTFAQHIQYEIRTDAHRAARRRDVAYFDDTQTGEVMSVLRTT